MSKLDVPRPASIGIIVFLLLVPLSLIRVQPVQATVGCFPSGCLQFPNNWAPYGPLVQNLKFQFYSSPDSELVDFEAGHLDLVDFPVPQPRYAADDYNPDFVLSPPQGQFSIYGIYFNGAASTWKAWGCDWNTGTPFTSSEQTYVTQCGINMRQAFAHLIDRPAFVRDVMRSSAQALADPSPPAKDPSGSSLSTQCSWDQMFPNCISAYNIRDDPGGFAMPGSPDFCAATDHMIAAGIATGKQTGTCVLTGVNAGVFSHPLRFIIKGTDTVRLALGNGFMNAVNRLFGANEFTPCYVFSCTFSVFTDPPESPIDDWDAYTYGYKLVSPYPDHLLDLFYSQHATDYCGGRQNPEPDNPTFVCISQLDQFMTLASQTIDINTFRSDTLAAFNIYGAHAVDIPVYSPAIRTVALHSVAGLVNQVRSGYPNSWTILNGHKDPNYTPVNPLYAFGGGDASTLRYGQASSTLFLNIFTAQTDWEFNVINEVYDTLLRASPTQPGNVFCWMCNTYKESFDATTGDTHFLVELRQNLRWHDGYIVDSKDVKFSLLNLRDFAPTAGGSLGLLKSVDILSPSSLDIVFTGQSISFLTDLVSYIIPRHLWELAGDTTYGEVGRVDPAKASPSYDPIFSGSLIGSGPFLCRSIFSIDMGRIGTGCTVNSDGSRGGQAVPIGGSVLLQAFDRTSEPGNSDPLLQYMRSYNPAWSTGTGTAAFSGEFQEFSWADVNDDAQVGIADIISIAACWHVSAPTTQCPATAYNYWLKPAFHPASPNEISTEIAIVDVHIDDNYVFPYSWNPPNLKNIIPFTP